MSRLWKLWNDDGKWREGEMTLEMDKNVTRTARTEVHELSGSKAVHIRTP